MRILHVIDALGLGGGAEQALVSQLPLLRNLGVQSEVVCLYPRERGLQEKLGSAGFDVRILQARSWVTRVLELRRIIKKSNPDLVHATLLYSCFVARFALIGLRVRQVNSIVNATYDPARIEILGLSRWRVGLLRRFDSWTARHLGGHFHVLTDSLARHAVEHLGIDPARITVIPRGRVVEDLGSRDEARRLKTRRGLGISSETPLVVTVGRQDLQKAHDVLVRAVALARREIPDLHLVIVGREGAATSRLRATIDEVEGNSFVTILGHREDAVDLIAAADVFALPSIYEGLGSVLIEAMALGTPIVGSNAPAIAEVLGDRRFGLVAPRGDDWCFASAIVEVLKDPKSAARRSDEGRVQFGLRYRLESVVRETLELYERVIR